MEADSSALACRGDSSAWELAKSRFVNDLEPSERQLYNNATLENLYYATSNNVRSDGVNSRSRIVIRKLGPLVSAIQSYGSAMDTFAQIAPLYLSPIWGSIRVLLVAAETYSKFYDKIVDVLARVGDILPRFRDYERIYNPQKHARLTQALSNSYLDIITLCTQFRRIIREHRASKIRRLLKPLSVNQQFDEAIETFRRHKQNVEDEARLCHMIEVSEEREARMTVYAAERRKRLLARLSKVDCQHRHRKLQGKRHEGTGIWMSQHAEYMKWESTELKPAVLCCHGIPGCGKSVLASTIVDSMKNNRQAIFYYCDYVDKRTVHPESIFGTLARQILQQEETISEPLALAIEQADHDGERLKDHGQALDILQSCLQSLSSPSVFILDGLDECTESSQKVVCDGLRHLMHRAGSKIKLYITARADFTSFLGLKSTIPTFSISISSNAIALDIDSYVRASTKRRISDGSLVIQDANLEELIVSKLITGAKGMFLWVEFQLNDLCDAESDRSIKIVLDNLPRSLSETYDRLLSRIEGTDRAAMIGKMFKWLVCARRPLHVDELRESVVFTLEDTAWDRDKIVTDLNRLVRACSNLVIVDPETQVVQLSHYTVEQYLLKEDGARFHFTRQEAETMAGEFCLAYLSFADFETRVTRYKENTNTDLVALGNFAQQGLLVSPYHPGQATIKAWNKLRPPGPSPTDLRMTQFSSRRPKAPEVAQFSCLPYIIDHWLSHTSNILGQVCTNSDNYRRIKRLYRGLVMEKDLSFKFRPWADFLPAEKTLIDKALFGWGLMSNNASLIILACELAESQNVSNLDEQLNDFDIQIIRGGCQAFLEKRPSSARRLASEENSSQNTTNDVYVCEMPVDSWLCSRYLLACRKGHTQAIKASKLFEVAREQPHIFLDNCAYEAALNGHLPLLRYIGSIINLGRLSGFLPPPMPSQQLPVFGTLPPYHLNATEHCVLFGYPEVALFLITRGQRIQLFTDDDKFFALLHKSVDQAKPEVVEKLLLLRLFLTEASNWQSISEDARAADVLKLAVQKGCCDVVDVLLKYGLSPDLSNNAGVTPLFDAIYGSHITIVKVLLEYQASTTATRFGLPLAVAAGIGNIAVVELLLSCSSVSVVDNDHGGNFPSMGYMIEYGRTPQLYLSPAPLYMACYNGHLDVVRLLVNRGALPFFTSPNIHIRLQEKGPGLVRTVHPLRLSGNDPTGEFQALQQSQYPLWATPLDAARSQGHNDIVVFIQELESTISSRQVQPVPIIDTLPIEVWKWILRPPISTPRMTIEMEFLIFAGVDLRTCYRGGQSLILWSLENKPNFHRSAIPGDPIDILLHALGELVMPSNTSPFRISNILSVIVQLFEKTMLHRVLLRLLDQGSDDTMDVLLDVFSHIICSLSIFSGPRETEVADVILGAIHKHHNVADDSAFKHLGVKEISALKSHYSKTNSPQSLKCLGEIIPSHSTATLFGSN